MQLPRQMKSSLQKHVQLISDHLIYIGSFASLTPIRHMSHTPGHRNAPQIHYIIAALVKTFVSLPLTTRKIQSFAFWTYIAEDLKQILIFWITKFIPFYKVRCMVLGTYLMLSGIEYFCGYYEGSTKLILSCLLNYPT